MKISMTGMNFPTPFSDLPDGSVFETVKPDDGLTLMKGWVNVEKLKALLAGHDDRHLAVAVDLNDGEIRIIDMKAGCVERDAVLSVTVG